MKNNGFTLIELLVVIAILAVLMTLGSKGLRHARTSAKKAQAMVEMKSIETAVKAYLNKYGELPVAFGPDIVFDVEYDTKEFPESEAIISSLTMADDVEEGRNSAQMVFLDAQSDGDTGSFRDPWGFQYRIALDTDCDGRIVIGGETVRRKVAVASIGLYHLTDSSSTNDLVKSWQ